MMIQYRFIFAASLALAAFSSACAPVGSGGAVILDGVHYDSEAAAISSIHEKADKEVAATPGSRVHVTGTLLIAAPTRDAIVDVAATGGGFHSPIWMELAGETGDTAVNKVAREIQRAGLFDTVWLIRSESPEAEPFGAADYKLTLVHYPAGWSETLERKGQAGQQTIMASGGRYSTGVEGIGNAACDLGGRVTARDPIIQGDACAPENRMLGTAIGFDGTGYPTRGSLDAAIAADRERTLAAIQPSDRRITGSVLIVLPEWDSFRAANDGMLRALQSFAPADSSAIDALTDSMEAYSILYASQVKQEKLFDRVDIQRADDPASVSRAGYDYEINAHLEGTKTVWLMGRVGHAETELIWDRLTDFGPAVLAYAEQSGASIRTIPGGVPLPPLALPTGARPRPARIATSPSPVPPLDDVPVLPPPTALPPPPDIAPAAATPPPAAAPAPPETAAPANVPPATPQQPFNQNDLMP